MAVEDEVGFILDDPLDDFPLGELHGLSDGGGEVDVPLFAVLATNELDSNG